jgi:hypothetical protein
MRNNLFVRLGGASVLESPKHMWLYSSSSGSLLEIYKAGE